jgi:hypothetical protein
MSKLILQVEGEPLGDDQLREVLSHFLSNDDAFRVLKAMARLMESGDLTFWVSTRLMHRLSAFTAEGQAEHAQRQVDGTLLLSWLEQGGNLEPNVRWEIQSLPDNGGIYRTLLKGGKKDEG